MRCQPLRRALAIKRLKLDLSGIKIAAISGIFALMGSAITGYFVVQGNEVIARKELKLKTAEIVSRNHDVVREKAEGFVNKVYEYVIILTDDSNVNRKEIRHAALELQKSATVLSIYSSHELGLASLELASALDELTNVKSNSSVLDRVSDALKEWHKRYYIETSSYSLELMPEASFKRILLQHFSRNDG